MKIRTRICIICMLFSMLSPVSYAADANLTDLNTDVVTEAAIEQYLQTNLPSLLFSSGAINAQNAGEALTIGSEIPTYIFTSSGSQSTEYRCYPIWQGQNLLATVYVFGATSEELCCQLCVSYADTLEDLLASYPAAQFALVFDAQGLNFVTEDSIEIIYYTMDGTEDREIYSSAVSDLATADMAAVNDVCASSYAVSMESVEGSISTQSITTLNLSVPFVSQEGYDLCWAAAMSSIGEYLTGTSYSIYTIAGWAGMSSSSYAGLDGDVWVSYFNSHYAQSYAYCKGTVLTYSTVYSSLTNGLPIYMVGRRTEDDTKHYHGVVIRGVYYNTSTGTRTTSFMDPSYSSKQYISATFPISGVLYFASANGYSYKQQSYAV